MTTVIPILAAAWALTALVALALCAVAGRADRRIEGWRNRETQ